MGYIFLTHSLDTEKLGISWRKHNIKIGNFVFIGARTIICSDVEIGDNSIIGAGSIVKKMYLQIKYGQEILRSL